MTSKGFTMNRLDNLENIAHGETLDRDHKRFRDYGRRSWCVVPSPNEWYDNDVQQLAITNARRLQYSIHMMLVLQRKFCVSRQPSCFRS